MHKAWEKDVILNVYMLEEGVHKGLEVLKHKSVAGTCIVGRNKAIHKVADILVSRALVAMLAMHHTNGIGHSSTVHLFPLLTTLHSMEINMITNRKISSRNRARL